MGSQVPKAIFALSVVAATALVGSGGLTNAHHNTSHANNGGYGKDQCKDNGWQALGFKNQGDCVSFFATGGKNQPG
jgi:hypothetical protein